MRIACVQLDHAMTTVFDRVIFPRYGLPLIGSIIQKAGHEVTVFEEHVAEPDMDWILSADVLLVSALTGAANRTYEFVAQVKAAKRGIVTIMGGEHATNFIEESLDWVDYVVRGEGDDVILDLLKSIEIGRPSVEEIGRISYRKNGKSIHNPISGVTTNINEAYDLDIIHQYPREGNVGLFLKHGKIRMITVQASRGCPFACSFCVVHQLFGEKYRYRDIEQIVTDIKSKLPYGDDFLFVDNLFTGNSKKAGELLDRMIEEGFAKKAHFCAFSRTDIAKNPEVLRKMRQAGVRTLVVGVESIDDGTLRRVNKGQSLDAILRSIEEIHDAGLRISATFVVGNEEEGPDSPEKLINFALKHNIYQIILLSLWAYPGDKNTPLTLQRMIMPSFDYFGGNFVVHFPMKMKPSTLQRNMVKAMKRFWGLKRGVAKLLALDVKGALSIFFHHYSYLNIWKQQLQYAAYLEAIEYGYYDNNECLMLDRIQCRPIDPIVERASKISGVTINTTVQEQIIA